MEVFLSVKTKSSFSYEDLIACGNGKLFKKGGPPLPSPPMLMFDKITKVSETGGNYDKGLLVAELNISPDLWFEYPLGCELYGQKPSVRLGKCLERVGGESREFADSSGWWYAHFG